jgi:spoIIIJ-associated protein
MDFSEKWGKDVEEATRLALIDLKLTQDQVNVIVLEEPSKGFFGLGSKLAKVRIEKKPVLVAEEKKEEKIQKYETSYKSERPQKNVQENKPETREIKPETKEIKPEVREIKPERQKQTSEPALEGAFSVREKPADLQDLDNHAAEVFLREITQKMDLNLKIKVQGNDSCIYIQMDGKDSGTIIGKRGQTLDAIQYLTSLVVNKDREKYQRVVVDAENYREKREKTLEQLAKRLADKVIKSRRSVRLEPMNPYERKVIHATLQSNPRVTTRSEGEEPYRRVIIELK